MLTFNTEVAVSLNDNNVQIYSKQGKEWILSETLSEVRDDQYLLLAN